MVCLMIILEFLKEIEGKTSRVMRKIIWRIGKVRHVYDFFKNNFLYFMLDYEVFALPFESLFVQTFTGFFSDEISRLTRTAIQSCA